MRPPGSDDFSPYPPPAFTSCPPHNPRYNGAASATYGACSHPVPPPPPPYGGVPSSPQGFVPYPSSSNPPVQSRREGRGGHDAPQRGPSGRQTSFAAYSRGGRGGRGREDGRALRGKGSAALKGSRTPRSCPRWLDDPWEALHARLVREYPRLEMPLDASSPEVHKWRKEQQEIWWEEVLSSSSTTGHDLQRSRDTGTASGGAKEDTKETNEGHPGWSTSDGIPSAVVGGRTDAVAEVCTEMEFLDSQHGTCVGGERKESGDDPFQDENQQSPLADGLPRKRGRQGEEAWDGTPPACASSSRAPLRLPPVIHGKNQRCEQEAEETRSSTEDRVALLPRCPKEPGSDVEGAMDAEAAPSCAPAQRGSLLLSLPPPVRGGQAPLSRTCSTGGPPSTGMSSSSSCGASSPSRLSVSSPSRLADGAYAGVSATGSSSSSSTEPPFLAQSQRCDSLSCSSSHATTSAASSALPPVETAASRQLGTQPSGAPGATPEICLGAEGKGESGERAEKSGDDASDVLCLDVTTLRQRLQERAQGREG